MARVASPHAVNIADLRAAARARLPRAVFGYLDGTADDGRQSYAENDSVTHSVIRGLR